MLNIICAQVWSSSMNEPSDIEQGNKRKKGASSTLIRTPLLTLGTNQHTYIILYTFIII